MVAWRGRMARSGSSWDGTSQALACCGDIVLSAAMNNSPLRPRLSIGRSFCSKISRVGGFGELLRSAFEAPASAWRKPASGLEQTASEASKRLGGSVRC
jgi:hypothetical protein